MITILTNSRDYDFCHNRAALLWRLNNAQLVLRGPKVCQDNIPHTITPPPAAWTVKARQDDPCFHVLYAKFWPYIWMLQQKSRLIRSGNVFQSSIVLLSLTGLVRVRVEWVFAGVEQNQRVCFKRISDSCIQVELSCLKRKAVTVCCSYLTGAAPGVVFCCWSPSASGFDVLCVQRCILQILVVTSDYLSYCCLSIISNQSVHSPLTSDINKAFSSTQLPLTGYFSFSDHSL